MYVSFSFFCTRFGPGIIVDFSRQKVTVPILEMLLKLARECNLTEKINAMFAGQHINLTEDRAVLHMALRSHADDKYTDNGKDVVKDVHEVLSRIEKFSNKVRSG